MKIAMKWCKNKWSFSLAFFSFIVLFSGCSSVQVSEKLDEQSISLLEANANTAHITVSNWGIYVLNTVPVFSGDNEEIGNTAMLEDHVNLNDMFDILTAKASELGASKIVDVKSSLKSRWIFPTTLLWYKEIELSGNAVK